MKKNELKANCPYKSDIKCDAALNLLCDNKCCYHPRHVDDGMNENYKVHRCPYSESTTCSGEDCGNDCCFHPDYEEEYRYTNKKIERPDLDFDFDEDTDAVSDYENGLPVRNLTEEEYIDLKKKFKAFDDGFEMGFNFALEKDAEKKCSLLKDKKNWHNGLAPCVGCERECPITAGLAEETPELSYDDGVIDGMNKLQEWYNEGRRVGYDKGVAEGYAKGQEDMVIECSSGLEDAYLDGYKACFYGEEPMVEDDEIRDILSEQPATPKGCRVNTDAEKVVNGDLYVSGKILCMIEDAKEKIHNIRKKIYSSGICGETEQRKCAIDLLTVVDLLGKVQHEYTSDAMYEYLGYME